MGGKAQTGGSAAVRCQSSARTQQITVTAKDAKDAKLSASKTLSWTVTSPPTVSRRLEARRLSSGRVEFAFRPQGGNRITPASRFIIPDPQRLNMWITSSEVYATVGAEQNRLLGQISVKHVESGSRHYLDVCVRPAGASARV